MLIPMKPPVVFPGIRTYFDDYSPGSPPPDWTKVFNPSLFSTNIVTGGGYLKGQGLAFSQITSGDDSYRWDSAGTVGDVEVLARLKTAAVVAGAGVCLRAGAARDNYRFVFDSGKGGFSVYRDSGVTVGTQTASFSAGVWYYFRLRAIGNSIQAKAWDASLAEPSSWGIDTVDSAYTSGFAGLVGYNLSGDFDCDYFCVAYDGASCPLP